MEKSCKNCLRNCQIEERYLKNLDSNGDKIDWNCWFKDGDKYWDFSEKDCDGYILNVDYKKFEDINKE